ncbi:hypothetical protein MAJ_04705, partial [Metarhizium majus ARSEF 297]
MAGSNETNDKSTENPLHATTIREFSYLFQLPPDLRLVIYGHVFQSIRLSSGPSVFLGIRNISARYSLALLRTCRLVRTEIGDTWLGQVLFNFTDTEHMMVKLKALPMATLSRIRHVRVLGTILPFDLGDTYTPYTLVQALKLLPGLQLDTFTVLSPHDQYCDYEVLDTLIEYGEGWKELRFICQQSTQLGYGYPDDLNRSRHCVTYPRKPQPAHWVSVMNSRDGIRSQPSVTMYRSTLPGEPCSVMHEATRVLVEQMPPKEKETHVVIDWGHPRAAVPMGESNVREFMVVVKRGKGIDYQEKEHSPHLSVIGDIREDYADKTWEQMKTDYIFWRRNDSTRYDRTRPTRETYQHVNEYTWRQLAHEFTKSL